MLFMDMEMSDIHVFIKFYLLWKLSTTLCDVLAIRNGIIFDYYPGPLHISFDTTINRKLDAGLNIMQHIFQLSILNFKVHLLYPCCTLPSLAANF